MAERSDLLRLRQELARDLAAAESLLADVHVRSDALAAPEPDRVILGYVAVTLHQHYTALETAFERIARALEDTLPKGADAHLALLRDMTLELPGMRPAVLRESTADALRPLLRFRHFVRHSYGSPWDAQRLTEVLRDAERAWPQVHRDVNAFVAFIDGVLATLA